MIRRIRVITTLLVVGNCLQVGCACHNGILGVDRCADIPAGAIPEPAGAKVCAWQSVQVASAIADQTALYQADFVDRTDELSPAARSRLSRHLQSNLASSPWVIEPSGDVELDAARVSAVANELSQLGITPADVQVATPAAIGLRGPQAERILRGIGSIRGASRGTGAPLSRPSASGGFRGGLRGF